VTASSVERVTLSPVPGTRNRVLAYVAASNVKPGRYRLRLAAVSEDGRRGSVVHDVEARLSAAEKLTLSDLLIFDPHPLADGKDRPTVSAVIAGSLKAFFEFYSQTVTAAESFDVRLEVASSVDGPALVAEAMAVGETPTAGRFLASGTVNIAGIEAGTYVARAVVSRNGGNAARIVRPIQIER